MTRKIALLLCLCIPALLASCHKTKSSAASFNDLATAAINLYYDEEPSCLWFEPLALPTTSKSRQANLPGLEALASQGILTRTQDKSGPRFQLADSGRKFFRPDPRRPGFGNLCYGSPRVQHIDSTTRRKDETFGEVTDVEYNSILSDAPAWTAAVAVQQAFPKMALEISRPLPQAAILKDTEKGWRVAAGPGSALPTGPAPK
jgi:hypothetical protein